MISWLKNYTGTSGVHEVNSEKLELLELKKEIKRLKRKYNMENEIDEEERVESASEHDEEEENDVVEDIIVTKKSSIKKVPRSSVSAEVYGSFNAKQIFVPKHIPKSSDQVERIHSKVLKSFIFNNLDEKELKTIVDAMEEHVCAAGDEIIKQGDPGAVLFIIEKGSYDCFKQFVSLILNFIH